MSGSESIAGRKASAGGARAASGLSFQAEMFAWWAARSIAGIGPGFGLDPTATVEAVGCETGFPVDDIGVALSDDGFILVQAKGGIRRLDSRAADLQKAVDQIVSAMVGGLRTNIDVRPIDATRDRLVIATNQDSSRSFEALGTVCERFRDQPAALPLDAAAVNVNERKALETFVAVIKASWVSVTGNQPTEEELRRLLRVIVVQRLDFETDSGVDRVRVNQMLEKARVEQPFTALVSLGLDAARKREWRKTSTLVTAVGLPIGEAARLPSDVDRLKELTRRALDRLEAHRVLPTPDGDVHVTRRMLGLLQSQLDSFLITGMPGVGKSGIVADLAHTLPGDMVVLAVDAIPADRALAQVGWNLTADLADVLRAWDGPGPATLVLDGLDAHRGSTSWLAEVIEELRDSRWRVIASVRRFELAHSRRWQQLFRGDPICPVGPAGSTLTQVRHIVLQNFDEEELATVTAESASLGALIEAGDEQLRGLVANPFNFSLAADLVRQVPVSQLASLHTQVQLLATYWQVRLHNGPGSYARAEAVRRLVEQMAAARSLEIIPGADHEAVEELVRRGVLEEVDDRRLVRLAKPVRFRHHIVFDFALAASLHDAHGSRLPQVLATDRDFVLFGRPAIDFHLADLWSADEDRTSFWRTAMALTEVGSPLAVAATTAVAVELIKSTADTRVLVADVTTHPAHSATVVRHLAGALRAADETVRARAAANIAAYDELVGALGNAWLSGTEPINAQALIRLVWELDALSRLPRPGTAARAHASTITRLLDFAVSDPAGGRWLGESALRFIVGAVSIDDHALPLLLRCLDDDVTAAWGLLPLRPVLQRLAEVAKVAGTAAGRLASAPFLFDASEDRTVSIGSSQILALHESWSQAHDSLRLVVAKHGWPNFQEVDPVAAMDALAAILEYVSGSTEGGTHVSWNGIVGVVGTFSQPLRISTNEDVRDLVDVTISALASRAADGLGNDEMLNIWTAHVTHSGAWYKLLQAATKEPQLGLQLRSALLESDGLFRNAETRPAAIDLAATLSPLIEGDEHAQLERIAIDLPKFEQHKNRRAALEVATDQTLVVLDASRIQTDAAKERLDEIARTGSEPPVPAGARWSMVRSEPMTDDDRWHLWGVESAEEAQAAQAAVAAAETALTEEASESDRWSALKVAVGTERGLDVEASPRCRLRYLVGQLVNSLLDSERLVPHDEVGAWIVSLIVALADDSTLPSAPEATC